ncbi:MAG TPA: hypothetical protein VFX35_08035 [Solirubrobacterales bacterium]|nr:hypothetical protein [Solirubrobacterales bacterium]
MRTVIAAALAGAMLCLPNSALAAPPANDAFANREVLSGALPLEVTGSNVEATTEPGETISGTYGHTVWFEWEAPADGWFTAGTCDSDFAAGVEIFTGTDPEHLTQVTNGLAAEGPDCGNRAQYTFRATAGTNYLLRVDGVVIAPPEGPPPPAEGTFYLRIEATPPPPNDAFAAATPIDAAVSEEPGGNRFYGLFTRGYNWTATTEPGEFPYGTGSGASVWYRWTPPETATYRISGPCDGRLNFALFSGGFGIEDERLAASCFTEAALTGGTTYWISVYGTPDAGTGEPAMGSFQLTITAELPPLPRPTSPSSPSAGSSNPPPDTTAPETAIDRTSLRATTRSAKFWFSASEPVQGFLCRIDKGDFKPCGSPRAYKHLKPGTHAFRVKAVDVAGNVDGSPAVARFRVPRPQKRR